VGLPVPNASITPHEDDIRDGAALVRPATGDMLTYLIGSLVGATVS
jgi:hypothetical protein